MNKKKSVKKVLALAAATATATAALSLGTVNAGTFSIGDVNLDGTVNLADAQLALKAALGINKLEGASLKTADITQDGKVNLMDAQGVLKLALGIEKNSGLVEDSNAEETKAPEVGVTTAPAVEATETPAADEEEVIYTILEDGITVVKTTPDEGIEGVDWEWRTICGELCYCRDCGWCLSVDDHGYVYQGDVMDHPHLGNEAAVQEHIDLALSGALGDDWSLEDEINFMKQTVHSGMRTKIQVNSYKVRLK